jgi:hypothetical protein
MLANVSGRTNLQSKGRCRQYISLAVMTDFSFINVVTRNECRCPVRRLPVLPTLDLD